MSTIILIFFDFIFIFVFIIYFLFSFVFLLSIYNTNIIQNEKLVPTTPLEMLQMIRLFNTHKIEMVRNAVRNFYEAESLFKVIYSGEAYNFMEANRTQWEHLIALSDSGYRRCSHSLCPL